jgi:hypothetical protein
MKCYYFVFRSLGHKTGITSQRWLRWILPVNICRIKLPDLIKKSRVNPAPLFYFYGNIKGNGSKNRSLVEGSIKKRI